MSELANTLTFQQRIEEKIKDSFADLVTETELKAIVEKGIERALWQDRTIPTGKLDYNSRPEIRTAGPLVDEIVEKHLKSQIQAAVDLWIIEHPDELKKSAADAVQMGIAGCVLSQLDRRFEQMLNDKTVNFQGMWDELHRIRQKVGVA